MSEKIFTATGIEIMVEEVIAEHENGVSVESVEPYEDYFTVKLNNYVSLSTLNAIARKVGSKYITVGTEDDMLTLFFKPGICSDDDFDDDDIDDYQEPRKDEMPAIPEDMRHTDRFPDAEDIVIPDTEQRVSNTEQCEQIVAWMKDTGRMPIVYIRLDDGIHVEVSAVFDRRIKAILAEGKAIGADARRYTFEKGGSDLWPIGSDICVRAICDETGRSDMYGLGFFV